ncbi:hypothetical protein ACX801_07910 [Arthrobacter bambusae]
MEDQGVLKRREVCVALELHKTLADLLRSDRCLKILAIGRRNIARMREAPRSPMAESWIDEWAEMIDGPVEMMIERMLRVDEHSIDLRQMSPFAGALTQAERVEAIRRAQ